MEIPGPVKPGRLLLIRRVDYQRMPPSGGAKTYAC